MMKHLSFASIVAVVASVTGACAQRSDATTTPAQADAAVPGAGPIAPECAESFCAPGGRVKTATNRAPDAMRTSLARRARHSLAGASSRTAVSTSFQLDACVAARTAVTLEVAAAGVKPMHGLLQAAPDAALPRSSMLRAWCSRCLRMAP